MTGAKKKAARTKSAMSRNPAGFSDPAVAAVLDSYPGPIKTKPFALRRLIFDTAKATEGVDRIKSTANQYAVYFLC